MAKIAGIQARKYIFDLLETLNYPVFHIGQHYKYDPHPYIVLKALDRTQDVNNRLGTYQTYDVMVYVPDTSVEQLDIILDRAEELLSAQSQILDITADMTEDFHDVDISMIMRSLSFRIPQTIRGCK